MGLPLCRILRDSRGIGDCRFVTSTRLTVSSCSVAVRVVRFSLVFIFLWMGLTACEHKDLCYDHPHFATVRVVFDWTKISNHDKPEGRRVVFYPT